MNLTFSEIIPDWIGPVDTDTRPERTEEEQNNFFEAIQAAIAGLPADHSSPVELVIQAPAEEPLYMHLHRYGHAAAVVWRNAPGGEPIAATVFLRGVNGADDVAAINALKAYRPSLPFDARNYNSVMAVNRPSVSALYLDAEWCQDSRIESASVALAHVALALAGGSVRLEPVLPLTPEEEAAAHASIDKIGRMYQQIHNEWARTNRFNYTVKASERVLGKSIDELKKLTYWVGVAGDGENMTLNELVATFLMIQSQAEQLKSAKHLKKINLKSTVNLEPTHAAIKAVLERIVIDDPQ